MKAPLSSSDFSSYMESDLRFAGSLPFTFGPEATNDLLSVPATPGRSPDPVFALRRTRQARGEVAPSNARPVVRPGGTPSERRAPSFQDRLPPLTLQLQDLPVQELRVLPLPLQTPPKPRRQRRTVRSSRCNCRRSSSSTVGTRTTLHTFRSPAWYRTSMLSSLRASRPSDFARRILRLPSILYESTPPLSTPRDTRYRCSQNPSRPAS